ncbi:hypothetical protein KZZ52_42775 [Dactylosporangium sp. AC04546]|uniref:WXG100 family type VII secretion target n=1 Tax=Dactylosporangium sp. AC04546 TaxID=2862460 RepID=UPI002E7BBE58|nr:hypothetical protein [Dactylosporangium sp. AC04546]WVK80638.1 hypothetical protein KZZ52_42775 [Dactylosporangium sp. AC04546]
MGGDYWGGGLDPMASGPNGEGMNYSPVPQVGGEFTPRTAGDGTTGDDIKMIYDKIMNQHPEMLTALAQQWTQTYTTLEGFRTRLLERSNALQKTWKQSAAGPVFMRTGPGRTLAYLDDWMRAANSNSTAANALAQIITTARADMQRLWREYEQAIDNVLNPPWYDIAPKGYGAPTQAQKLLSARQRYTKRAQTLAAQVAGQMIDVYPTLTAGSGQPFFPPNAVLNVPGHPPLPGGPPGGPPGRRLPGKQPPGKQRPGKQPPGLPGGEAAQESLPSNQAAPKQPPTGEAAPAQPPQAAPVPPPTQTPPMPVPPGVVPIPAAPPALGAVGLPPVPAASPVVPTGLPTGAAGAGAAVPRLPPSLSVNGVLGAGQSPTAPGTTGSAIPMSLPPPNGQPRDDTPGAPLRPVTNGVDAPFAPPTSSTPGVLARPTRHVADRVAPPPSATPAVPGLAASAPPVLVGPVTRRSASPDSSRSSSRPGSGAYETRSRDGRNAGFDWLGITTAQADATTPVLDRPVSATHGDDAGSIVHAAGQSGTGTGNAPAAGPRRQGQPVVPPELTARHLQRPAAPPGRSEEEGTGADTGRWEVPTPGGGVVGREEELGYREEPRPTLRGT